MQGDTNRKTGRQREAADATGSAVDTAHAVGESIRQAFLTHMSEQQRQYPLAALASRRSSERSGNRDLAKEVRQQQHTGNHEKPGREAVAGDVRGGTRAGAENVEPKKRRGDS